MITPYNIPKSLMGVNGYGRQVSNMRFSVDLLADNEEPLTVPGAMAMGTTGSTINKYLAIIKSSVGGNVWVAVNQTAEIPVGNVFVSTTSELVGEEGMGLICNFGDTLSFITHVAASVSVVFYGVQLT